MNEVQKGIYRHYQGKEYQVLGVGNHSETLEKVVIYKQLYDAPEFKKGTIWVRPLEMFLENVIIDGKEVPRFELIDPI